MNRDPCPPPSSDGALDRHQFYAKVSCNLSESNNDIDGLGRKVSGMYAKLDHIGDTVKEYATKGNTVIACISVLWLMLGSGLTMYVNSVIDAAKETVATVESLEKKVMILEASAASTATAMESLEKLKRNIATMQTEMQEGHQ